MPKRTGRHVRPIPIATPPFRSIEQFDEVTALLQALVRRLAEIPPLVEAATTLSRRLELGVPEGGLEAIAAELSGLNLGTPFEAWLRSTSELPLAELLARELGSVHLEADPAALSVPC